MTEVLVSQLAHAEIFSPKPQETVDWLKNVLGLEESGTDGRSTYLRGWSEWFRHSVQVTEGPEAGLGHIGWRARGPEDPEILAGRVEGEWVDGGFGHGKAFRFRGAGGHVHELFWDVELYAAPDELKAVAPDRPQAYRPRGVAARYIDHVTIATADLDAEIALMKETLKLRHTGAICPEPGFKVFSTLTPNVTHELGLVPDFSGMSGRINHLAFRVDQRSDVHTAAQIFAGHGSPIEFGPGIHGIDEITYLYVREPGGLRIELNAGGWVNHMPDWQAPDWRPDQGPTVIYNNLGMPDSMMESFPTTREAAEEFHKQGIFAVKA